MKKFLSLLLAFVMVTSIFAMPTFAVEKDIAEVGGLTLEQIKVKFPENAYWNHITRSGHGWQGDATHLGPCNNPDGYTWTPCASHSDWQGAGSCDCNSFEDAVQCIGFAKKVTNDVYGKSYKAGGWSTGNISNAKAGDVIHYRCYDANAKWGHWVIVVGRSSNTLTVGECNIDNRCKISWSRKIAISSISSNYTMYVAPYEMTTGTHTPTEKPGKPYPTSKSLYPYGENVTLSWEPVLYATNYWLDFYKDGTKIDGRSVSSPLVLSSLEPGKYSAYITATNALGQTTSDACNFEVFNSAPGKPYPTPSKSAYLYGETVTLNWNAATHATNYWLDFYKDGVKIDGRSVSSPLVLSDLKPGKYEAYVTATNTFGNNTSEVCIFEVVDSAPAKPHLTSNKSEYPYGESVTLSWDSVLYATNYWLDFYKDGTKIDGRSVSSPLVLSDLKPGKYEVFITATNPFGQNTSEVCSFAVFNSAPGKPYVTSSKSEYSYGEDVTLTWDKPMYSNNYWLDFYKDGVKIDARSVENPLVLTDLETGKYEAYITANNLFGHTTSDVCIFEVKDKEVISPDKILGDVDGDKRISIMDATEIQRHIAQLTTISEDRLSCADTDRDTRISIMDATQIQRFIAQLIPEL